MTMKHTFTSNDEAVSPVVGVMLMLVVTIIIAAVVSAFAGGMAETEQKAPQITLGAEAHNGSYILIEHLGGDPLDTEDITVKTFIPSGTFADCNYEIVKFGNQTYCATNVRVDGWYVDDWGYDNYDWAVFQPGDQIKINWTESFGVDFYGVPGGASPGAGESFFVKIYDNSGKLIVTAQTIVLP